MPGVPRELYRMMDEQVLPRLAERRGEGRVVRATLLRTFGMGESNLDEELSDIAASGDVVLGFRTAFPDNYLRPLARGDNALEAERKLARVCAAIRERLGPLVYAEGDETLPAVVGRLLREQGKTVAVAESCTGGLIAERISDVEGASEIFRGGFVASSSSAVTRLLDVPEPLLEKHGLVSDPVVRAMAESVRERFGADFGVATVGIAAPGGLAPGGQEGAEGDEKPAGLVHIAIAQASGTHAEHFVFPLDRQRHRQLTAQTALDWVRRALLGVEIIGPSLLRRRGGGTPPARG
jgi:nicotinamide-nucleotide amidase